MEGSGRSQILRYFRHLPGGTKEKHENSVWIAGLRAEIWTWDLPNTNQKC
jgi:hypothetical protein